MAKYIKTIIVFLLFLQAPLFAQDYLLKIQADSVSVASVAVSSDNSKMITAGWDKNVKVWDAVSGSCTDTLVFHSGTVLSVACSPNNKYFASAGWDKKLCLWDTKTKQLLKYFSDHTDRINLVCFSPDNKLLATASDDNTIILYDIVSLKQLQKLTGHTDVVTSICFTSDSKNIVSGSWDKSIKVWDVSSGNILNTFKGHYGNINAVAVSPTDKIIASVSDDNSIKLWSITQNTMLRSIEKDSSSLNAVAFSNDGKLIAVAGSGNYIKIWTVAGGVLSSVMKSAGGGVRSLAFNSSGSLLYSAGSDGAIKLWDMTYYKYEKCIKEKLSHYAYLIKPKDEFETTDQYNKRIEKFIELKAGLKDECINDEQEKYKNVVKESYQLINLAISNLSAYDADQGYYMITIDKVQYELKMPVEDAKTFKTNYLTAKISGIKRFNPDSGTYEYINISIIHPVSSQKYLSGKQIDPANDKDLQEFYLKNKIK